MPENEPIPEDVRKTMQILKIQQMVIEMALNQIIPPEKFEEAGTTPMTLANGINAYINYRLGLK